MASSRFSPRICGLRDLVFTQINTQCEIWNNVVYLNDVSAKLNEQDFFRGDAIVDLRPGSSLQRQIAREHRGFVQAASVASHIWKSKRTRRVR